MFILHLTTMQKPVATTLMLLALLVSSTVLSGCLVAGVTSTGHFFLFPSLGVIVLIIIVLLVLRRR